MNEPIRPNEQQEILDTHSTINKELDRKCILAFTLIVSLLLSFLFNSFFPDGINFFDTFFQGIAALLAVSIAYDQLRNEAEQRKQESKDEEARRKEDWDRRAEENEKRLKHERALEKDKAYDTYLREAMLLDAWVGILKSVEGDEREEGKSKAGHHVLIIENSTPGTIRDYSLTCTGKNGELSVPSTKNKGEHSWSILPKGIWCVLQSNESGFDWVYPKLVSIAGNRYEVIIDQYAYAVEPYYTSAKRGTALEEVVSIRFSDCYGNEWERRFSDGVGKESVPQMTLMKVNPEKRLLAEHLRQHERDFEE